MRFRRSLTLLLCALLVSVQIGAALHALSHLEQMRAAASEHADLHDPAHRVPIGAAVCDLDSAFGTVTSGAAAGAPARFDTALAAEAASTVAHPAPRPLWIARQPRAPPLPNLA